MLDLQQCVMLACLLDITVPKPGNVHRGADFEDVTFLDFAASAVAIAPHMARANSQPLGQTVLRAVTATQSVVQTNTNLGIVLLLAPLSAVMADTNPNSAMKHLLRNLTEKDALDVFKSIRMSQAGGLGTTEEMDVHDTDTQPDLMKAMELAKNRDRIAQCYVSEFDYLLTTLPERLTEDCTIHGVVNGVLATFVEEMSTFPDTLIARKCGNSVARESAHRASLVRNFPVGSEAWEQALSDLDFWLRADGHKRNPGTTADFITAGLFVALIKGLNLGKLDR